MSLAEALTLDYLSHGGATQGTEGKNSAHFGGQPPELNSCPSTISQLQTRTPGLASLPRSNALGSRSTTDYTCGTISRGESLLPYLLRLVRHLIIASCPCLCRSNTAFESYEHPDSIITSVGLVRPKPGVFIDSISWVLVLCTPSNVTLLGLAFEKPNAAPGAAGPSNDQLELRLYVTDLTIQTDGVTMSGVKGTSSGRLFCHGSDQCLYEIVYQAAEGWFSSKCSLKNLTSPRLGNFVPSFIKGKQECKSGCLASSRRCRDLIFIVLVSSDPIDFVTVDDSRNVLYTLHRSLEIEIWHLPSRDSSVAPVRIARASDICKHAQMLCPGSPSLDPRVFAIVWLGVVSPKESKNVHLVAVTRNGVRLYFSHHRGGVRGFGYRPENAAPTCLELVHVRPPPSPGQPNAQGQGFASQNTSGLPDHPPQHHALNDVRHAAYADGILVAASAHPNVQGIDNLFYATPSVSQHERPAGTGVQRPAGLWETATDVLVEGVTFAIAEVQQPAGGARLNPLATQMTAPPRIFLALTNSGLIVLTQRRPVDVLRALLEVGSGQDQNVIAFFER